MPANRETAQVQSPAFGRLKFEPWCYVWEISRAERGDNGPQRKALREHMQRLSDWIFDRRAKCLPFAVVWRQNNQGGMRPAGGGRTMPVYSGWRGRFDLAGWVWRPGWPAVASFEIELKVPVEGKRPERSMSPEQKQWLDVLQSANVLHAVCDEPQKVVETLKGWCYDEDF